MGDPELSFTLAPPSPPRTMADLSAHRGEAKDHRDRDGDIDDRGRDRDRDGESKGNGGSPVKSGKSKASSRSKGKSVVSENSNRSLSSRTPDDGRTTNRSGKGDDNAYEVYDQDWEVRSQ
jgi:hypothetical protein